MNDILVLVMNACALMTISYIAIKLRGRMGTDRLLPVSLLTGLASIVMMALPHPMGFPMHDMRYAPVIMVSLRFGELTACSRPFLPFCTPFSFGRPTRCPAFFTVF
ncbi:hypothetical protein N6H14_17390 [Paenibacillus sp. CC-CFT747]|nr:hypothetical protein N6H14_17390 [Paenibacillus sp. CC-CFT747]